MGAGEVRWILPAGGEHETIHQSATLVAPQLLHGKTQLLPSAPAMELRGLQKAAQEAELFLESLSQETGFSIERSRRGTLLSVYEDHMIRKWGDVAREHEQQGAKAHLMDPFSARNVEPTLGSELAGCIFMPEGLAVRRRSLMMALEALLTQLGVRIDRGIYPLGIETINGAITGLRTRRGTMPTEQLVVCEFPEAVSMLNAVHVRPAVEATTTLLTELAPGQTLPGHNIMMDGLLMTSTSNSVAVEWTRSKGRKENLLTLGDVQDLTGAITRLVPGSRATPVLSTHIKTGTQGRHHLPVVSSQCRVRGLHYTLGAGHWEGVFLNSIPEIFERKIKGVEAPEWTTPMWCTGKRGN